MYTNDYRPFSLNEIVGQKTIIKEFKNKSLQKNYPDVMLFVGNSGTGKSTSALVISAILNCLHPIKKKDYVDPCGECVSCQSILSQKFNRDTLFYDASKMGKEDIVQLENVVSVAPMFDENKIVIIDEAQNLISAAAKGATLKLLEKKRKNVYFILCTMNPEKLAVALKSRCQKYYFKDVNPMEIGSYLFSILEKEKIDTDKLPETFISEVIPILVESCNGSVREAVSNLERIINSQIYTEKEAIEELDIISHDNAFNILGKLLEKKGNVLIDIQSYSNLEELFFVTRKFLVDIATYIISKESNKSGRYEKYIKNLSKYVDNTFELIQIYTQISTWNLDKNLFLMKLCLYLKNNSLTNKVPTRKLIN